MSARRKYQVFISSTYTDMKEERQAAVEAILTAGHIPAGMELFSAGDESQLEAIKRWIIESDIYLLILGARYGTLEPRSGLSYTEIEYDYAVANNKPHFALVLSEAAIRAKSGASEAADAEIANEVARDAFRGKVLAKVSRFVDDTKDVKIYVPQAIRGLEERHSIVGWIRSDDAVDAEPLIAEISRLTGLHQELESELRAARGSIPVTPSGAPLAGLDDPVEVSISYTHAGMRQTFQHTIKTTWGSLFALVSPKLIGHPADSIMREYIGRELLTANGIGSTTAKLTEQSHNTVRIQFEALGLIVVSYAETVSKTMSLFWNFTDSGKALMLELRAVRKP